jgi:TonB family protein
MARPLSVVGRTERLDREGIVMLQVVVDGSGELKAASVIGDDADPMLAAAAMAAVNRALPLPALPPSLKGAPLSFRIPLRFILNRR